MKWIIQPILPLVIVGSVFLSGCSGDTPPISECNSAFHCSITHFDCAGCEKGNKFVCDPFGKETIKVCPSFTCP